MVKRFEAARVPPLLYILLAFLIFFVAGTVSVSAETVPADEKSDTKNQKTQPFLRGYMTETPETESEYPLFRSHAERYYPALDLKKASRLSTFMPGLGQAYAGNYTKATLFLTVELGDFCPCWL